MEEIAKLGLEVDTSGFIRAKGHLSDFGDQAKKAETRAQRMGKAASEAGKQAARGLGFAAAAMAGIAANSVRLATTFESELTKINTLVGVSRSEIDGYRASILSLAPAVGRGPEELARAMFAITSAGSRGSEAMDLLEASSRAAAIGLGDTRDIALAAGAAVTAYGRENLSAAEAVEIMIGTIEQGNLEASQLAGVLGNVLGIASEAGVSLRDAGAFIASFTRQGVDASQAVTGLRGAITLLVRQPTKQAEEAFEAMGMSVAGFKQQVRDEGFIDAFQQLVDRAKDAGIEIGQIIPEVEGLSGVLSVFSDRAESAASIAGKVGDAVGTLGDRFEEALRNDPALAFAMVSAEFTTMQTRLGVELLPALMQLIQALKGAEDGTGPLRDGLIGVAGVILTLAEYGTLAAGMFVELGQRMGQVLAIADRLGQAASEEFGLSSLFVPFKAIVDTVQTINRTMEESGEISAAAREDIQATRDVYFEVSGGFAGARRELLQLTRAQRENAPAVEEQARQTTWLSQALDMASGALRLAAEEQRRLAGEERRHRAELEELADEMAKAAEAAKGWADRLADVTAELLGPAAVALRDYQRGVQEVALALQAGETDHETAIRLVDALGQQFERTAAIIRDDFIDAFNEIAGLDVTNLFGDMFGGGESGPNAFAAMLSEAGRGFAQSIFNGQNVGDAIGSAFTGTGGRILGRVADDFFADAAEHGLGKAFSNSKTQEGMAGGFALALGQALEGNYVQAGFTAAGTAIAGPIGGMIGSMIGSIVESLFSSKPKFQIRGEFSSIAIDEGTDRLIETALGRVEFAFRGIEGSIKSQVIAAITEVDSNVAAFVRNDMLLDAIGDALQEWGASSRAFGDDFEAMVRDRLRAVADTFPEIIADFVNSAQTAEGMLENLYSVMAINRALVRGISLGLPALAGPSLPPGAGPSPILPPGGGGGGFTPPPDEGINPPQIPRAMDSAGAFMAILNEVGEGFEAAIVATEGLHPQLSQTVEALLSVRIGTEPLIDTFNRMARVLDTLDGATALLGASFGETRMEAIEFGADLVALFGDNADALASSLSRIFGAIYTETERAEAQAGTAAQRAGELLTGLLSGIEGIEFDDAMLTLDGFRDVFETLMQSGTLTPEQVAVLIEAGNALVDLSEAQARLTGEIVEAARDAEGVAEILAGMKTDQARAGLEGVALALFDLDRETSETRAELERMGATAEEMAQFERMAAQERMVIIEDFAQRAAEAERAAADQRKAEIERMVEAERRLMEERQRSILSLSSAIDSALFSEVASRFRNDVRRVTDQTAEWAARAAELGQSEQLLGRIRAVEAARLQQIAGAIRASLLDSIELLWGSGAQTEAGRQIQRIGQIAQANEDRYARELRAIEALSEFLDSGLLADYSPLTPGQRVGEARSQLLEALAAAEGGDIGAIESLPGLADQFFRLFSEFTGGVGAFPPEFRAVMDRIAAIEARGPLSEPPSQRPPNAVEVVSGFESVSTGLTELQRQLALSEVIDNLGLLAQITGRSPSELANELGIPLGDVVQAITGELPGLTGEALGAYFDEVVNATNAQLNELATLETLGQSQLGVQTAMLELIAHIAGRSVPGLPTPETPGGPGGVVPGGSGSAGGTVILPPPPGAPTGSPGVLTAGPVAFGESGPEAGVAMMEQRLERIEEAILAGNRDRARVGSQLTSANAELASEFRKQGRRRDVDAFTSQRTRGGC